MMTNKITKSVTQFKTFLIMTFAFYKIDAYVFLVIWQTMQFWQTDREVKMWHKINDRAWPKFRSRNRTIIKLLRTKWQSVFPICGFINTLFSLFYIFVLLQSHHQLGHLFSRIILYYFFYYNFDCTKMAYSIVLYLQWRLIEDY